MKYSLGFTAGALLHYESTMYINCIEDYYAYLKGEEIVDYMAIPTNSESSKKRLKSEIDKRLMALPLAILKEYSNLDERDQKIVLFLGICKVYPIVTEFCLEEVYVKWKNFSNEISTYDFQYFLNGKLSEKELSKLSEVSLYKLSQVAIKMLKEVGILMENNINKVIPSPFLYNALVVNSEGWILDCLLVQNEMNK